MLKIFKQKKTFNDHVEQCFGEQSFTTVIESDVDKSLQMIATGAVLTYNLDDNHLMLIDINVSVDF